MIPVEPFEDRVLMREIAPAKMQGGIYIPDVAAENETIWAEVVAAGPGRTDEDGVRHLLDFQAGEHVFCFRRHCMEISLNGEDYLVVSASHLLAARSAG